MKIHLGVIFGGNSVEHEISIITALQNIEHLDTDKYEIFPIFLTKDNKLFHHPSFFELSTFASFKEEDYKEYIFQKDDNKLFLKQKKNPLEKNYIDVLFPIVHGTNVEDGKLQGYLNRFDVPVIGPTPLSGAIGQDKAVMKDVLLGNKVSQIPYIWVIEKDGINEITHKVEQELSYPVILKPASLGSSVGIEIVENKEELKYALMRCFSYDDKVVIEKALTNFDEYNISMIGSKEYTKQSCIEKVLKDEEFLSYEDKYMSGSKSSKTEASQEQGMASLKREIPAKLDKKLERDILRETEKAFRVLQCNGVVRFDIIIANNTVYINEVNNIPGALSYYFWVASGMKHKDFLDEIINLDIQNYYKEKQLIRSFDTNILQLNGKKTTEE
ncbi:MAG: hypothetical protein ACK5HS_00040 [Mycoplasmatales bacterium]